MIDIYDFYERMEEHNVMLSFKGEITSELLSSILQIMESKLDIIEETPKVKKKVFNVLVECLQNLYHHIDELDHSPVDDNNAIFMIANHSGYYNILTGNHITNKHVPILKEKIDKVNELNKDELKAYYKEILNNGLMSEKGGGGLGMIDIARKSGQKLEYSFMSLNDEMSFFTLKVKVEQLKKLKDG
jgi:Na+/phosphate symporter